MEHVAPPPGRPDVGVIVLPATRWSDTWRPCNYVVQGLSRHYHMLWVNPAEEWREAVRDPLRSGRPTWSHPFPGVTVYDPEPWLPVVYSPAGFGRVLRRARLGRARRFLERKGCRTILLYLWRPEFAHALEDLPHDGSFFHIDDEYSFADHEVPLDPAERALILRVDGVIIHSPALMEKKGHLNPATVLVPNGVIFDQVADPRPEPSDLTSIPTPRIGYMGYLKKHLDWALLEALALRHPGWSFVYVGGEEPHPELGVALERLRALPNVHLLGEKPTAEILAYPQHFDVCILPYRRMPYTEYIYPLKLHEYLATGRPVVGTPIRSLQEHPDVVRLASTVDEWGQALEEALDPASMSPGRVEARKAVARHHDWNPLTDRIAAFMAPGRGPKRAAPVDIESGVNP